MAVQPLRQLPIGRKKLQQVLPHGIRDGDDQRPLSFIMPQPGKALFFLVDVRHAAAPTGVDVEAFPVALPAGGGFVEAAAERQNVAGLIFEDAGFFVEQRRAGQRAPLRVAGHGHFDFQDAVRHPHRYTPRLPG